MGRARPSQDSDEVVPFGSASPVGSNLLWPASRAESCRRTVGTDCLYKDSRPPPCCRRPVSRWIVRKGSRQSGCPRPMRLDYSGESAAEALPHVIRVWEGFLLFGLFFQPHSMVKSQSGRPWASKREDRPAACAGRSESRLFVLLPAGIPPRAYTGQYPAVASTVTCQTRKLSAENTVRISGKKNRDLLQPLTPHGRGVDRLRCSRRVVKVDRNSTFLRPSYV